MKDDLVSLLLYVVALVLIGFGVFAFMNEELFIQNPVANIDKMIYAGLMNKEISFFDKITSNEIGLKSLGSGITFLFMARTVDLLFQIKNK